MPTRLHAVFVHTEEEAYLCVAYVCPCCEQANFFDRGISEQRVRGSTFGCAECGQILSSDFDGDVYIPPVRVALRA